MFKHEIKLTLKDKLKEVESWVMPGAIQCRTFVLQSSIGKWSYYIKWHKFVALYVVDLRACHHGGRKLISGVWEGNMARNWW